MHNLRKLAAAREHASRDKAELFDFYNDNWDALLAEISELRKNAAAGFPVMTRGEVCNICDECDNAIPDTPGGGLANKHHEESCSLYAPDEE